MSASANTRAAKPLIFVFGLLVVCLGIYWLLPWVPGTMGNRLFVAFDVALLYVVVFAPLLMQPRLRQATTGRLVSLGVLYWGIGLYAVLTLVVVALACTLLFMATRLLVLVQLVGLFALVVVMYLSLVARDHADEQETEQGTLMRNIQHIRSVASSAAIDASTLGEGYAVPVRKIEKIREEVRYLSPVSNGQAYALEDQICRLLEELSNLVKWARSGGATPEELSRKADEILLLVRQRKALIN